MISLPKKKIDANDSNYKNKQTNKNKNKTKKHAN